MNEWRGYFNLQVSQGRQIFNKIQGGAHIVYITDSPTHVYTNIMRLVLLRERERERERYYNNLRNIYAQTCQHNQVRKSGWYWTFKRISFKSPTKTFNQLINSSIIVAILHCFGKKHKNLEINATYYTQKIHLKMKPETLMAYRDVSFVQFPIKSGILPVKGLSDAPLKRKHIYSKLCP